MNNKIETNQFKIRTGLYGDMRVWLNGGEVLQVTDVKIVAGTATFTAVSITFLAEVNVEVEPMPL